METPLSFILAKIDKDLAWRGPTGRPLGHIVLTREEATHLSEWAKLLIHERDQLLAEKESRFYD